MAQASAAGVIDLEVFCRRREAHPRARPAPAVAAPAALPVPCWILWVPVWFVA
jgi:hypothetical protein